MLSNLEILRGAEYSVLVVDDEPGMRFLIGEILQEDGRTIHMAGTGQQALNLVEREKIDLILLDVKMPGMNGIEVYKNLKGRNYQGIVVMMTANGEDGLIKEAKALGIKKFLIKPFDIEELKQLFIDKEAF